MNSSSQTLKNNSTSLTEMSTAELGNLIINGQPGSQLSRDAIMELTRRSRGIRNDMKVVGESHSQGSVTPSVQMPYVTAEYDNSSPFGRFLSVIALFVDKGIHSVLSLVILSIAIVTTDPSLRGSLILIGFSLAIFIVGNHLTSKQAQRLQKMDEETQRLEAAVEHERAQMLEKQAEAQRLEAEAQRLEAALKHERAVTLQRLIRESSHDMKAPLSALNITLHLLNKFAEDPERRSRYSDNLQLQMQHLVEIIDTMKQLALDESQGYVRPIRTEDMAELRRKLASVDTEDSRPTRPATAIPSRFDDDESTNTEIADR